MGERERQTDRQTDRQRDREREEREGDTREKEREGGGGRNRAVDGLRDKKKNRLPECPCVSLKAGRTATDCTLCLSV